jgi:hypothetical protein
MDIDVNEDERLPNITLKTQIRLESKDKDVNEHERLPNITLKTQIRIESKDKEVNEHERLPNITLKSLSCSFTSISLLSNLICVLSVMLGVSHVHLHLYPYFLI